MDPANTVAKVESHNAETAEAEQKKTKVSTIKGTKTWCEWVNFICRSKRQGEDKQSYRRTLPHFLPRSCFSKEASARTMEMLYLLSISG